MPSLLPRHGSSPSLIALIALLALASTGAAQERPNILWLVAEDMSPHIGSYGVTEARTPHMDKLAGESVLYSKAFANAPVCAVMRASLLTGLYSPSQGTHHMRNSAILGKGVKTYPEYLRATGYYCTNPGKTDYQGLADPDIWDRASADYRQRPDKGKPFMHVANFNGTHESQILGNPGIFDPAKLPLPPYYPDTPKARSFWAGYFNAITSLDAWVAARLDELEKSGEADNTMVFLYSDHGAGLPRAKRWVYDSGLRIPLMVRIPARFLRPGMDSPGTLNNELVSSVDLAPTVLNLAGVAIPGHMQGRAFLGTKVTAPRKYVFASRDRMDERFDIVRAVRDGRYKYIRNYEWFQPRQQYNAYPEENAWSGIMEEIRRVNADGANPPPAMAWYFRSKPVEELYDTEKDPHEMVDLARLPESRARLAEMRAALGAWRRDIRDLGALPEGMILEARKTYGSEYDFGRQDPERLDRAWSALDSLPWKSAAELAAMLGNGDPAVRYWAATGLGNLGTQAPDFPAGMAGLEKALRDASPWVAVAAARGLLLAGLPSAAPAALALLETALKHADRTVRHAAALACDEIGNRALPLEAALQAARTDSWEYVQRTADRALATLEVAPVLPPVLRHGCPDPASPHYRPDWELADMALCGGVSIHERGNRASRGHDRAFPAGSPHPPSPRLGFGMGPAGAARVDAAGRITGQ